MASLNDINPLVPNAAGGGLQGFKQTRELELSSLVVSGPGGTGTLTVDTLSAANYLGVPGGASDLSALDDVIITSPGVGDHLYWNGSNWIDATPDPVITNFSAMDDVTITSPSVGSHLYWNGSVWIDQIPNHVTELDHLDDVEILSPSVGMFLRYDNGDSTWRVSSVDLSELDNVNAASPSNGDVLKWNTISSEWQDESINFLELTDTPFSFFGANGKILKVNAGATAIEFVTDTAPLEDHGDLNDVGTSSHAELETALGALETQELNIMLDGGGSQITSGLKTWVYIPSGITITDWTILADQTGSIEVDVLESTYASWPTTASMTDANYIALSSQQKAQGDSDSWAETALASGSVLEFFVNEDATSITRAVITVEYIKTII